MLEFINKYLLGFSVPCALMAMGLYFLFKLKFFPITKLRQTSRALTKNGKDSFRALALSLAGTLGVGNIVGVASAIYLGGFGAIFWMWVSALLASVLKYAEILLAMRHKDVSHGTPKGGAPYYIRYVLWRLSPRAAVWLSSIFAILCIANCLFMGAAMQTSAITEAASVAWKIPPLICGLFLAVITARLLCGGAKAITRLTSLLVPFMSLFYVVISLAVIIPHASMLPLMLTRIFRSAFTAESAAGGIFGFLLSRSLRFGVMRGLFSNEAGCGTSPTAHIASSAHPCEQGFMGILEVFIDTILLCSMTGFVIMIRYDSVAHLGETPMKMVLEAYSGAFSPLAASLIRPFMAFMVLCFGFAAISCLAHYAESCIGFVFQKRKPQRLFIALYSGAVFWGAVAEPSGAWALSDLTIGIMTLINLAVLFLSRNEISAKTDEYFAKNKNIFKNDKKFTKYS